MAEQAPMVIVLAPLLTALLVSLLGLRAPRACGPVAVVGLFVSLGAVLLTLVRLLDEGPITYALSGWPAPIGIVLRLDGMNALVLVAIAVVAILTAIISIQRVAEQMPEKTTPFYVLYLLLASALFGMTMTGDAFNLFVLVEVSSLTSYGLIAMGSSRRGTLAAFNYIIMGTTGASLYLLGVGYLYMRTGTLNMADIHEVIRTNGLFESPSILVAFILMTVGVWIKMAFFPLYGWLPNAYSYCPSSTSCILAPLMTKVSVYVMIRVLLSVFGAEYVFGHLQWQGVIVWLAVIAILAGSLLALAQTELKKMLCYLIVAEVGYMVGGAWLANHWGMVGALYHVISDAFMTLLLFVAAGLFWWGAKCRTIDDMGGMFRKMPLTMAGFVAGGLAIIGVPPTCGFFSKWFLIRGGIEAGRWEYVAALLLSSLVNAVLFFRIIEVAYFGKKPAEGHGGGEVHGPRSTVDGKVREPLAGVVVLWVTVGIVFWLGIFHRPVVSVIERGLEGLPVVGSVEEDRSEDFRGAKATVLPLTLALFPASREQQKALRESLSAIAPRPAPGARGKSDMEFDREGGAE